MAAPVSVREDQLTRLVALSPGSPGDGRIAGLVRRVCAQTLSLPPLPVVRRGWRARVGGRGRRRRVRRAVQRRRLGDHRRAAVAVVETVGRQHLWCGGADVHRRLHSAGAGRAGGARRRLGVPRVGERADRVGPRHRSVGSWCSTTFCPRWPGCARWTRSPPSWSGCAARRSTTAGCASRCARAPRSTPAARRTLYGDIERFEDSPVLTAAR